MNTKVPVLVAVFLAATSLVLASCAGATPTPTPTPKPAPAAAAPAPKPPPTVAAPAPKPAPTAVAPAPKPAPSPTPKPSPEPAAPAATVALGGKLYDNWMKTAQIATPKENSPLWAAQTTNTRTGADTWRCKECHGWDYKGKDGAYGKGSHLTGFPGVFGAATTKTAADLTAALKGSANPKHNFATYLKDEQLSALAAFLKAGAVLDEAQYIDYATKKPKSADAAKGKQLYSSTCAACHGPDGKTLNFGNEKAPEYVGTIAKDNPWEFTHKVRFGQPGQAMPAGVELQWTIQDVMDVLAHSQTLPDK